MILIRYLDLREIPTNNIFIKFGLYKKIGLLLANQYFFEKYGCFCWNINLNHKPILDKKTFFNISHSGNIIIVAFSDEYELGVDIEKIRPINVKYICSFLHDEEKKVLKKENFNYNLFYDIWTKKESFLKATGIGLNNKILHQVCVLNNRIVFNNEEWYLNRFTLINGYKSCICANHGKIEITYKKIEYRSLKMFTNKFLKQNDFYINNVNC